MEKKEKEKGKEKEKVKEMNKKKKKNYRQLRIAEHERDFLPQERAYPSVF